MTLGHGAVVVADGVQVVGVRLLVVDPLGHVQLGRVVDEGGELEATVAVLPTYPHRPPKSHYAMTKAVAGESAGDRSVVAGEPA